MRPLREYLIFGLLSSGRARCWNHANTEALDASLAATGVALVACECSTAPETIVYGLLTAFPSQSLL